MCCFMWFGMKMFEVDVVMEYMQFSGIGVQFDQVVYECMVDVNGCCCFVCCFLDQVVWIGVLWNQVQIGVVCGDDEGFVQFVCQNFGGNVIGIVVVCIDEIEVEVICDQFVCYWQCCQCQCMWCQIYVDVWWQEIVWMMNFDVVVGFQFWCGSKFGVVVKVFVV